MHSQQVFQTNLKRLVILHYLGYLQIKEKLEKIIFKYLKL